MSKRDVVVFIGLPGAGKSTAAERYAELIGTPLMWSTGNIVRELAEEYYGKGRDDISSTELGEFSTMKRENDSPMYIAREVVERAGGAAPFPSNPLVLEGPRDSEALSYYRENFDRVSLVLVETPWFMRRDRIADRGREGEGATVLEERDRRERDWGMDALPFHANIVITNDSDLDHLDSELTYVAKSLGHAY